MYGSDVLSYRRQYQAPAPVRQASSVAPQLSETAGQARPAAPQTFSQMREAGYARPPMPAVSATTRSAVEAGVANPSAYGAPEAMSTFNRLNTALSEQFGLQRRQLDGQAARRGIFDSSLAVGQLGDLGVQQARAQTDLAGTIAEQQALQAQQDRASAISQALQLGQMDTQSQQFTVQQALARALGLGGLDLQNRQLDQQNTQFGQSQQLTRDQMLQQLAMFFGLPTGTDIGGTEAIMGGVPTLEDGSAYTYSGGATVNPWDGLVV